MIDWLKRNRTSVRLAFILRIVAMAVGSLCSILWYRVLLHTMGDALFGLFQAFQGVTRLGGLGDLGISGAVGIRTGMMLGRREDEPLRRLLASARTLFLFLAVFLFLGFAVLSPWLPHWLGFRDDVPGVGSLPLLFVCGGTSVALLVISGYFASLNFAYGTVSWPVLPGVFTVQIAAPLAHWCLARHHAPLWLQYVPYAAALAATGWLAWLMLKVHPWLSELRPLGFEKGWWKILATTSGWAYLSGIGSAIYFTAARLVLNAGFGPTILPTYLANYKTCELAVSLILTASFVSLPKLTHWISSPDPADRRRLVHEAHRLNIFQIVLGCAAVLAYLAFNDLFVKLWLGAKYQAPLAWQLAFAANLAITVGGDTGMQIATRCGDNGLKKTGLISGGTGLLNVLVCLLALWLNSVLWVAAATVIAQTVLSLSLGWITCRHMGFSMTRWTLKSWLLPLGITLAAGVFKYWLPGQTVPQIGTLLGCYAGLFIVASLLAGLKPEMLRAEIMQVRAMFRR